MQVPFHHVFSSEINPRKRKFIEAKFASAWVYPDMVRRHPETFPRCNVYVCGFPCKPFSTLHTKSRGFQEVQARPFTAVLRTIRGMLPAAAVLENVFGKGRGRYLQKVWARLASLRWYEVLTVRSTRRKWANLFIDSGCYSY